uniref:Uncharacterized protein n=1 Tax=Trypanosoma congolense (strain IL3000) TaxID=1068625 RepID=G0UUB6_TRYCI|nr:conserved hypothetical protein [Trypanosoma congolense IL3000]
MLRYSRLTLLALVKGYKSEPIANRNDVCTSNVDKSTERMAVFTSTASEAPELLLPYVEPTPFVSAKRYKAFVASMFVGATAMGTVYYMLSESISGSLEEGNKNLYLHRVAESNKIALLSQTSVVPEFAAPSSFAELAEKMRQHERELELKQAKINDGAVMLHAEVGFRMKLWWNTCLTHIQEAADNLARILERRRERIALENVRDKLEAKGYELVRIRGGNTNIW